MRDELVLQHLARIGYADASTLGRELKLPVDAIRERLLRMRTAGQIACNDDGSVAACIRKVQLRSFTHMAEKTRIAAMAAAMVEDGDQIAIGAGTTCAQVVTQLRGHRKIQIVTNSLLVLREAAPYPNLTVVLSPGRHDSASDSLIGPIALRSRQTFAARLAFLGGDGFAAKSGLTSVFPNGAALVRAMHDQATESWLLADSTKHGIAGFVKVMDLRHLTGVITDDGLSDTGRRELAGSGARVLIATR